MLPGAGCSCSLLAAEYLGGAECVGVAPPEFGVVAPEPVGAVEAGCGGGGGGGSVGAAAGVRRPGFGGSEGGMATGEIGDEAVKVDI